MLKRAFDITCAVALLMALAVPMALIAIAVRLTSRGPALYWSNRVGRDNRVFSMPKFRTMRTQTPEVATHLLADSRRWITPLGRFLRKTSLDEFPQLWSILVGHMSFVGPRPALHNQADLIALRTELGVHRLLPGLTGWAQINGRDELSIPEKVAFDRAYLEGHNLLWDARILLATAFKVFRREGVAQTGDAFAKDAVAQTPHGHCIGIDGSNLRSGGSITHLSEILKFSPPPEASRIVVWGGKALVDRLPPSSSRLTVVHDPVLDRGLWRRLRWKRKTLPKLLVESRCDLLYVPAGACLKSASSAPIPVVTMSRNLLPFEATEFRRFGWASWMHLKMRLLRRSQIQSFRRAEGVLFLTEYARATVMGQTGPLAGRWKIVPHGVDDRFRLPPRDQRPAESYTLEEPFRFLYVSKIDAPKHQWHVAEAVGQLRAAGLPVALDLVGPVDWKPGQRRVNAVLKRVDPRGEFIRWRPGVAHRELPAVYRDADAFAFASSCENLPNILLEAMASGLPIACAAKGPMPEVLGEAGAYFDPDSPESIARALTLVFTDFELRAKNAAQSYRTSGAYSWKRCARDTFAFLIDIAAKRHGQYSRSRAA